eukprot:gene20205-24228_t
MVLPAFFYAARQGGAGAVLMALMAGLLGAAAQAHGQLYVCADAQGHKTYTDKSAGKHCQLLDLPGAMTEPPRRTAPLA